jgi:Tfp pilus assembly protein PilO
VSKRVIAIAVVVSVVLAGVWYLFVFSSQSNSLHKANTEATTASAQVSTLRSQIAVLQQEKAQLPAATTKLTTLQLALPSTPALDKLIDDINSSAQQTGVDWQTLSPTKPAAYTPQGSTASAQEFPGGMVSVVVALQVEGSYQQILGFVTKLDTMSRLLDVDSVNISNVAGAGKTTAEISTQVFYVPPAAGSTRTTTVAP